MKKPDPQKQAQIDAMLQNWQRPKHVAGALNLEMGTVYKYADHLGYRKVYLNADEIELVSKYRVSRNQARTVL
jgi:hypothetical protein